MADCSVDAREESNESEASQALMFVLTMLFRKSLALLSIWSLCFVLPPRFCVPECHRNIVESSTTEKVLYFQFPRSPLRGNKETEARSSRSPKELLKQLKVRVGIDLRKCVSDHI